MSRVSPQPFNAERPLDILDVSADEESAYRWLLARHGATAQDLAQGLSLPVRKAQRLLDTLESKGLATYSPQRPRRYFAASPSTAMEALVLKRMEDLQRARSAIQELQEQTAHHEEQDQLVELITSREAERQAFEYMQRTAQHEFVGLIRLPILVTRVDVPTEQGQSAQREAQARGVHFRSIVDIPFMETSGVAERVFSDVKAGEDIRVVPSLPFKMVLADRRIAFIPLNLERPDSPSLLVRSSALVDALYALFEGLWERAVPIAFMHGGTLEIGDAESQLREQAQTLVSLLAAGLPDKAVAQELDISASTLNRRIVEIMATLNASTRFQLGWLAALKLSGPPAGKA